MPLGTEVNLSPGDIVVDGVAAPPQSGTALQFSAHVYCGQMAGWMKMPLRMEVDLSPGHIVLDGDAAPPAKGAQQSPLFSAHVYCGRGRPFQLLLCSCFLDFMTKFWSCKYFSAGFVEYYGYGSR